VLKSASKGNGAAEDTVAAWTTANAAVLAPAEAIAAELHATSSPDLAMLVVAGRQLRQALG
jgi:NAD-specific glutamate dehydrogenase